MQYENDGNGKWRAYVDNHSKKKVSEKEYEYLKLFVKNIICGRNCEENRRASYWENQQPIKKKKKKSKADRQRPYLISCRLILEGKHFWKRGWELPQLSTPPCLHVPQKVTL